LPWVEAGLRSHDLYNPFPEEANRRLASVLAEIHFAPTALSRDNLRAEGVAAEKIVVTGNTVIDTLRALNVLPHSWENTPLAGIPDDNSRLVLFSSHRRKSWGANQEHVCMALKDLVQQHPDIRIVYPVHTNPNAHHGEYAAAEHGQNSSDRSTTSRSSACCGVVFWC
jgi:UDP-N-acetylglucosamine 2-epimerase (non-hydrolysing)